MASSAGLAASDADALRELAPVLERAVRLNPTSLVRLRLGSARATALVLLPFAVLVSRSITASRGTSLDVTVGAVDVLAWLDDADALPAVRDLEWRGGLPPESGWTRVETVPDSVIRPLVRQGALTLKDAAAREGVPGAQPRAEVADALLNSIVLTVRHEGASAEVSLRALSALTRMGFLPKGGHAFVDTAGRWVRVVAEYGTVYLERPRTGLVLA